jgi:tRNA-specific 2-thiouridylase
MTKQRVVVAMSGGVDSSVAAYLLKQQGYDVVGISLKVWDETETIKRTKTCCSYEDIRDAESVCEALDIPFYAFNYKREFREKVIKTFVTEYSRGYTPNPCILCNRFVKFDQLLKESEQLGARYLATGHHARCIERDGRFVLAKGVDEKKDQSYVLHHLDQSMLAKILLPVGIYTKEQIRLIASEMNLPTATKPESQDICFIPNHDHASFIEKHFPQQAGQKGCFVDRDGNILGEHQGIHAYTVGQRRGLGIGFGERKYVVEIRPEKHQVILGEVGDLYSHGLNAVDVSFTHPQWKEEARQGLVCLIKVRYQKSDIPARVVVDDNGVCVYFDQQSMGVSPGQSVVFYVGDEVCGGGRIESAIKTTEHGRLVSGLR